MDLKMEKDFREHFFKFKQKIVDGERFAFARYSDGEMFILQNKELVLDQGIAKVGNKVNRAHYRPLDFKNFNPNKHQIVRKRLIESFQFKKDGYYKGVSCSCCVGKDNFDWQIDLHDGDDDSLTWANLWVNGNYPLFMKEVVPIFSKNKCVFIGHETAKLDKFPYIVKDFRIGYNAMVNDYDKIDNILDWIGENNIEDHIFLFSASSFSNLAIYRLFDKYPKNTYIDIGTTLSREMGMPVSRGYINAYYGAGSGGNLNKICVWN